MSFFYRGHPRFWVFYSTIPVDVFISPHVKGLSEQLRRCLQQHGVRAVFKSETTLRSQLVQPKDAVDPVKQDGVVYRIPCERGKVYIGETRRPMQDRIKEHTIAGTAQREGLGGR